MLDYHVKKYFMQRRSFCKFAIPPLRRIINNIKEFEKVFSPYQDFMVTGGSDTHLMVLNTLDTFGLNGKDAEALLEEIGILTNRQVIPNDTQKPYVASGIRLGTTWITARGYTRSDTKIVAEIVLRNLEKPNDTSLKEKSKKELKRLLRIKRNNDVWREEVGR